MRTRFPLTAQEIVDALRHCNGDVEAAAQYLDISTRTLYRRMAEFGIRARISYEPVSPASA